MTDIACAYCPGTRWLMGNEALGPCVCVTPAALRAAEEALEDALAYVDEGAARLADYLVSLGLPAAPLGIADRVLMRLVDLLIYRQP